MSIIIDGKAIVDQKEKKLKKIIDNNKLKLKLAIIKIGEDEPSNIYVNKKIQLCQRLNISYIYLPMAAENEEIIKKEIEKLNKDKTVTGIIIELPIPQTLNKEKIIHTIDIKKDVDNLTGCNKKIISCTAQAIIEILNDYKIHLKNKKIVLIGYSSLIGQPLEKYFLSKNTRPIICNSKTKNIKKEILTADIIITATGKKNLITKDMIKSNCIIIDAGITKENNKIYGDVDYKNCFDKCYLITPTPNGVGPLTTITLIENLIKL